MPDHGTVVFVCEHGAAKSVLAAAEFNALAHARGSSMRAVARGTAPDDAVAPVVRDRLTQEGIDLGAAVPRALSNDDTEGALRVVTFDQPQVAAIVPHDIPIESWNGMPAVSADFDRARQAIRANVQKLVDAILSSDG